MRLLLPCFTVLFLMLSLTACTPTASRDPFAYAAAPFSLTVEGTYLPAGDAEGTPRPFAARISAGAPVDGDPTLRDLTVTFTAPDTLAGLTVTAALSTAPEGTVTRTVSFTYLSDYGQVSFTAESGELDGLLRYAEAWLPIGDVAEVSPKSPDGGYIQLLCAWSDRYPGQRFDDRPERIQRVHGSCLRCARLRRADHWP